VGLDLFQEYGAMRLAFNRLCFDLAEADSFYHIQARRVMNRLVEGRQTNAQLLTNKVIDYVTNRQNEDGGYTFCQGAESNRQDTYYGLAILSLLGADFPNIEKTLRFLKEPEWDLDNIYSNYYTTKALLLCGEEPNVNLKNHISLVANLKKDSSLADVLPEVSSEFTTIFMTLELADLLGIETPKNSMVEWLLQFRNKDGGFGLGNHSNINSTYYAIASLALLKAGIKDLRETVKYARECEKAYGGFTLIPMSVNPYMEHTYYGVMTLHLLGETCRYPSQTIDFLLKCQNKNGGFARSDLGISTFENTFQSISVLRKLGFL
jgi:hypothetical protein